MKQINRTFSRLFRESSLILSVVLAFVFAFVPAAQAQDTGQIAGTVTDPIGATVPNATVSAKNLSTNAVRTVISNGTGAYVINGLTPATYELSVNGGSGFSRYVSKVEVTVGGKLTVDPKLALGQATTTVEVSGAASDVQINTTTQELSQAELRSVWRPTDEVS